MSSPNNNSGGPTSVDLKYASQRVYTKTKKGLEQAEERLKTTAFTTLDQGPKDTIMAALKAELKTNIILDQEIMPARSLLDYDQLVEGCIRKVFDDNLELSKANKEDNPGVDELIHWEG
ncbi:hypothetical protein PG999_000312 [Apiospora kogelbergensis]|uniref:Uncharacterized protein n=1 Tax=Apiospora kogelbergensis TaxID=1337665 RepID=A0AAW0RBK7_9PEZI